MNSTVTLARAAAKGQRCRGGPSRAPQRAMNHVSKSARRSASFVASHRQPFKRPQKSKCAPSKDLLARAEDTVPVNGHWHVGGFPAGNRWVSTVIDALVAIKSVAFASILGQGGLHPPWCSRNRARQFFGTVIWNPVRGRGRRNSRAA
jgi:hypothetical protein